MATKKSSATDPGFAPPAALTAMFAANPAVAKALSELMSESVTFVAHRYQANLAAQQALMACRTPMDLMEVYAEFLKTAMQQYADETSRVIAATTRFSEQISKEVKSGHSRGYDDVPV